MGAGSELAINARQGVQFAVQKINARGGLAGHPIEMIYVDNRNETDMTTYLIREYYNQGVRYFIGPFKSRFATSVISGIQGSDVLYLNATMTASILYHRKDRMINMLPRASEQGKTLATYMLQHPDFFPSYIIRNTTNRVYVDDVATSFEQKLGAKQNQIQYRLLPESFRSEIPQIVQEIVEGSYQSVVLFLDGMDASIFAQTIRMQKPDMPLLGLVWSMTSDLISQGGRRTQGMICVGGPKEFLPIRSGVGEEFWLEYRQTMNFPAVAAYEALILLEQASNDARGVDKPSLVLAKMLEMKEVIGLKEKYHLDAMGDAQKATVVYQLQDSIFVRLP